MKLPMRVLAAFTAGYLTCAAGAIASEPSGPGASAPRLGDAPGTPSIQIFGPGAGLVANLITGTARFAKTAAILEARIERQSVEILTRFSVDLVRGAAMVLNAARCSKSGAQESIHRASRPD